MTRALLIALAAYDAAGEAKPVCATCGGEAGA